MAILKKTLVLTCILLFVWKPLYATTEQRLQLLESQIKAGMIYNFLKYTEWPESALPPAPAPYIVCILGNNSFSDALAPLEKRTVNQHTIKIHILHNAEKAEAQECHLLFIGQDKKAEWLSLRLAVSKRSILTVSDAEEFFVKNGGMIEFRKTNNQMDVGLNMQALQSAQLQVHDRLLALVTIVHPPSSESER